jgi:N-methylhydantoinase B
MTQKEGAQVKVDKVTLEVMRIYFQAVVEEMARVVERTAFTTFVKETADFSTGLISTSGEYIAYPWKLGATGFLGLNMRKAIDFIPCYDEGDIVLMNDPYTTGALGTHLPDLHALKPIFYEGEIVAYGYAFIHFSDVGGTVPASIWPRAVELFQEGFRLRPTKLFRAGVLNQDVLDILLDNCRIPERNWGDIKAMVAGLNTCERRVHEIIVKFGLETVKAGIFDILDLVEQRARGVLASIPAGSYSFVDYLEDDLVSDVPIRIALTMTVKGDSVHLDFTGTDPQVSAALNIPTDGGPHPFMAHALMAYIFTEDNSIHKAGSVMRPITMTLPEGTVVNPQFPAACGVRWATVMRVVDTVLGALAQAVPGKVPAAPSGAVSPIVCSLTDPRSERRHVAVVEPLLGGAGGRWNGDGVDAGDPIIGFTRNTPAESIEADIPIVLRRYHLIPDSGGPGRYRGGMGIRMDFQVYHPDTIVVARGLERFKLQPWGIAGGLCGTAGEVILNPDFLTPSSLGKIDSLRLEPGDIISFRSPSGGGYGDPLDRDPELVAMDVHSELVSERAARDEYGVVLHNGVVDAMGTAQLRAQLRAERGQRDGFDYGPFRHELEERWPPEISGECARLVNSLPTSVRDYAKHRIFEAVQEVARTRKPKMSDVHEALDAVMERLNRALP